MEENNYKKKKWLVENEANTDLVETRDRVSSNLESKRCGTFALLIPMLLQPSCSVFHFSTCTLYVTNAPSLALSFFLFTNSPLIFFFFCLTFGCVLIYSVWVKEKEASVQQDQDVLPSSKRRRGKRSLSLSPRNIPCLELSKWVWSDNPARWPDER